MGHRSTSLRGEFGVHSVYSCIANDRSLPNRWIYTHRPVAEWTEHHLINVAFVMRTVVIFELVVIFAELVLAQRAGERQKVLRLTLRMSAARTDVVEVSHFVTLCDDLLI